MSLYSEYKSSLKAVEVEELFDLILYRPLAFIFVKATYSFNLTPDRVSIAALLIGSTAGVFFGVGSYTFLVLGALLYFTSNVLDCADGQIARLKHNGTKVGRIVDGLVDYIVSTFVFVGISIGLTNQFMQHDVNLWGNALLKWNPVTYVWFIGILGAVSSAAQAFVFDFYRNKYLEVVFNKAVNIIEDIKDYEAEQKRFREDPGSANVFERFLVNIYLKYTRLQLKLQKGQEEKLNHSKPNAEVYSRKNKMLLMLWSYIGSTTHITLCIICALLNNMEAFLVICILPLNLLMLVLFLIQKQVNKKLT